MVSVTARSSTEKLTALAEIPIRRVKGVRVKADSHSSSFKSSLPTSVDEFPI